MDSPEPPCRATAPGAARSAAHLVRADRLRPQLTPDLAAHLRDTTARALPPARAALEGTATTSVRTSAPASGPRPMGPPGGDRRLDADCRWYVLHTRSRQEKILEETLRGMRIGCYLPLRPRDRRSAEGAARSHVPLFPGYVFLWGNREELFRADRTRRVANLLDVADQSRLEWELAGISMALATGASLDPYPAIREGVRVRVASGPFEGVEGIVARRDATDRLVLQVRVLNTAASLDIAGELVDLLDA